jgi:hypothetical protein
MFMQSFSYSNPCSKLLGTLRNAHLSYMENLTENLLKKDFYNTDFVFMSVYFIAFVDIKWKMVAFPVKSANHIFCASFRRLFVTSNKNYFTQN